jgi:hypothetical protein
MTSAYPLSWPPHIPRTKFPEKSKFSTTLPTALKNVQNALKLFAKDSGKPVSNITISSNCALGMENPADAGVAVWFVWDGLSVCIPSDRHKRVSDNLQALFHIIEADRVKLRHGSLHIVRATFTGFQALPPPTGQHWWDILKVPKDASVNDIDSAYRREAKGAHPDVAGGSDERMKKLNRARQEAVRDRTAN